MGSFIRKAGITAAAVTIGLGLTALPASADKAQDKAARYKALNKSINKAIVDARKGEQQARALMKAKVINKKRVTTTNVTCAGTGQANADALVAAFAAATVNSVHNVVLASGCTFNLGDLLVDAAITIPAGRHIALMGTNSTIISAPLFRHFILTAGSAFRVYSTTLQGTGAAGDGGITNGGNLTVYGSTMTNNHAANGGAILSTNAITSVYNSTLSGNASLAEGGAISSTGGQLVVSNTVVSSNIAATLGGGVYNATGLANLINSLFQTNGAATGGGTYNAPLSLMNGYGSLWSANNATASGGAIANQEGFYGRLIGLTGNSATTSGGGLFEVVDADSVLTLSGGYVTGNVAGSGGGIMNSGNLATNANVSGTDVSSNTPTNCVNVTGCSA